MTQTEIIALAIIKYGPALGRALMEIFAVETPTKEQWEGVFALAVKPYEAYVDPMVPSGPVGLAGLIGSSVSEGP